MSNRKYGLYVSYFDNMSWEDEPVFQEVDEAKKREPPKRTQPHQLKRPRLWEKNVPPKHFLRSVCSFRQKKCERISGKIKIFKGNFEIGGAVLQVLISEVIEKD